MSIDLPMLLAPLAQVVAGGSVAYWAVIAIIVAAVVAVAIVVMRQMGVSVPPFIINVLWIVFAAAIGIVAIRFLLQLAGFA